MKILIIANARYKGGLSGSDAIYLKFKQYWPADIDTWTAMDMDFKPFVLCYVCRILWGMFIAIICPVKYDMVYSASDFLMDVLPAFILKAKGRKWVAGFFLFAPKHNKPYVVSQKISKWLIDKFADMVIVTNKSMYHAFKDKKKTWINGGIDLIYSVGFAYKKYDAVYAGRIHSSKGIDELLKIWRIVSDEKPDASLVVIGDGDLGKEYIQDRAEGMNITCLGYMGNERYQIYHQSKVVLYPATEDHFSMMPVEAMACGCPMIAFNLPVMQTMKPMGCAFASNVHEFADMVLLSIANRERWGEEARQYARDFAWDEQAMRVWSDLKDREVL
jgi:glycosyltransferase involved in cell wall biosynthesis